MPRIYAPVDEATLEKIDKDAEEKGTSRAQWVSTAIESHLQLGGANPEEMHHELVQLRTEKEQTWREITHLKRTEEKTRTEATQALARADKLQMNLEQAVQSTAGLKEELATAKAEADKLREVLKTKNDEIAFLRATIHQLTEKITPALPPSEEEAKRKRWYQFWRRG